MIGRGGIRPVARSARGHQHRPGQRSHAESRLGCQRPSPRRSLKSLRLALRGGPRFCTAAQKRKRYVAEKWLVPVPISDYGRWVWNPSDERPPNDICGSSHSAAHRTPKRK